MQRRGESGQPVKGQRMLRPKVRTACVSTDDLQEQLDRRTRERDEALEQQTATSEVLKVISSSAGELKPVFESILKNAVRICEASFGNLLLYENDVFRHVALHNAPQAWVAEQQRDPIAPRSSARFLYHVAERSKLPRLPILRRKTLMNRSPRSPVHGPF
jgi:hypothetical protein